MKSSVHFLNVSPGACTIIQHESGRVTMIDICNGCLKKRSNHSRSIAMHQGSRPRGNFSMRELLTNPLQYLFSMGIDSIFRFILTHPDMDHMDGLHSLTETMPIDNFWLQGTDKAKPSFDGSPYCEKDWDSYENIKNLKNKGTKIGNTCILTPLAGTRFKYANEDDDQYSTGDSLYILAPDKKLIQSPDVNDTSYVLLYDSPGGEILIPGDADDESWEYVLREYGDRIRNCSFLLAPHHGRDSGRSYEFLNHIRPKLTLFGSAPSKFLAYEEWRRRDLEFITTNQVGNTVLEIKDDSINVYIENENYARAVGLDLLTQNNQGFVLFSRLKNSTKPPGKLSEQLKSLLEAPSTKNSDQLENILSSLSIQKQSSNIFDELFGNKK